MYSRRFERVKRQILVLQFAQSPKSRGCTRSTRDLHCQVAQVVYLATRNAGVTDLPVGQQQAVACAGIDKKQH